MSMFWQFPSGADPILRSWRSGEDFVQILVLGLSDFAGFAQVARPGDHQNIYALIDGDVPDAQSWETGSGESLGTGINPLDFSAADTGDVEAPGELVWIGSKGDEEFQMRFDIRAELPVYTTPVSITEGAAGSYTLDPGAATGATPINHILTFNGADVLSEVVSGMWLHNDRGAGVLAYQSIATSSGGVVLSNNAVLTIETQSPGWVINDQNVIESIGLPSPFAIAVDDENIITLEIDNG